MSITASIELAKSLARIEKAIESQQAQLGEIERRLGTEQEREHDLEDAREIAHKLSNLKVLLTLTKTRPSHITA